MPARAMGPVDISHKAFTKEKEECLLAGECDGHRRRGGARD